MNRCEWCEADSGRFNVNRECCQVRLVVDMPDILRKSHYEQVRCEKGRDAAVELIQNVNAERRRLLALRESNRKKAKDIARAALGLKS